jgi:3-oxoacyl-[acyl-carrier protein] reductase
MQLHKAFLRTARMSMFGEPAILRNTLRPRDPIWPALNIRASTFPRRKWLKPGSRLLRDSMCWPFLREPLALSQGTALFGQQEFKTPGFREVLEVNLTSLMTCCTKFHSALKDAEGAVIIVSFTAAYHATHGNPACNASKAGAVGLTRTLGMAWARGGIRVNGIAPGLVATKLTQVTTDNPDRLKRTLSRIPLKRPGTADEMAGVALFLGSPQASYIVGQTIIVDGGLILY